MGVLNVTPDSFYDGGKYQQSTATQAQIQKLIEEGADLIDVGGYSSRPGAQDVSVQEELNRVLPTIELIQKSYPEALISIDTFRAEVARRAIEQGADMINDISGGELDPAMFETIASLNVPYVLMHMRGTPQTMKTLTDYDDLLLEMISYFEKKVHILRDLGQKDIIIDPGFGFAKNITQNYYLLQHLECFDILNLPVLVGISRKSMIYKVLGNTAQEALNGTTVLNSIALLKKASFLRVHDVKAAREAIQLTQRYHQEKHH